MILIENLNFFYERKHKGRIHVIKDFNYYFKKGTINSIIAPSGSGKSTLLKVICGLLEGENSITGEIKLNGLSPSESRSNQNIGYVSQTPTFFSWLSILDNILIIKNISRTEDNIKEYALKLLIEFGLKDIEYSYPYQLSGACIVQTHVRMETS